VSDKPDRPVPRNLRHNRSPCPRICVQVVNLHCIHLSFARLLMAVVLLTTATGRYTAPELTTTRKESVASRRTCFQPANQKPKHPLAECPTQHACYPAELLRLPSFPFSIAPPSPPPNSPDEPARTTSHSPSPDYISPASTTLLPQRLTCVYFGPESFKRPSRW
jgi:hypothetical protein